MFVYLIDIAAGDMARGKRGAFPFLLLYCAKKYVVSDESFLDTGLSLRENVGSEGLLINWGMIPKIIRR
jgi:hypothetical protein